ncbi:hypothetical protein [Ancylomarina sp. 16SWW S1-10-2]|uniref:hypothetical protein n=1 Tax=Ancylomarina sp. 16SWW S1-10-2 TaxID=2499681 RepID=UPI0012AE875F|nr:hypothetical protein [Ancylomarina sp. 16SWW S1-10-2]MRT94852.1 hypothetical protein [Ancylomarina sp. 16SWW S1-10-2]
MNIPEVDKKKLIQKIINSKRFSRSEILRDLLNYLFKAHQNNENVKAINIAIDLLQRKGELKENDETLARVYVHKLRSKLTDFYINEGLNEKITLQIPKGKYELTFQTASQKSTKLAKSLPYKTVLYIGSGLILLNLFILAVFFCFSKNEKQNPIWANYLNDKKDINLMLSNPFFYTIRNLQTDSTLVIRSFNINSEEELNNSQKLFSEDKYEIKKSDISYFANNNISSLPLLFKALHKTKNNIHLKTSNNINLDDIKNNNTIAITSLKSIGLLGNFLDQTSIRIPNKNGLSLLLLSQNDTIKYSAIKSYDNFYTDYAFLIKIPTPKGKSLMIISDSHSIGNKGLMELATSDNLEEKILSQYQGMRKFPNYFELLVKVTGYQEQNLTTEIIHFKALN